VAVAPVCDEAENFPETRAAAGRVDGHRAPALRGAFEQCRGEPAPYAGSAVALPDIKPAHTESCGKHRIEREAADRREPVAGISGKKHLARPVEPKLSRSPIPRKPLDKPVSLGPGLRAQCIEAGRQRFQYLLQPNDGQPL
jgi:hypothetical protein